jgi:hypothetical protein
MAIGHRHRERLSIGDRVAPAAYVRPFARWRVRILVATSMPLSLEIRHFSVLLAALFVPVAGPSLAFAQGTPMGLRLFGDVDFEGPSGGFVRDSPDLGPTGLSRAASSLQVASGEVWELCTELNFRGRCRTVNGDIDDLRRGGWNDVVVSVRRVRGSGPRFFDGGPRRPGASGLHLYGDINFKGASATLTSNAPDLREQGMDRAVSSLELDPDEVWEVCTERDFRGRCQIIREDQADLRRGNWNDVIMSARRVRGGGGGIGRGSGGGLEVFGDINFRGRSAVLFGATANVGSRGVGGGISSVRVSPGEVWEVCAESNFRGRCDLIFQDVADLRKGEWNDAIQSARRVR